MFAKGYQQNASNNIRRLRGPNHILRFRRWFSSIEGIQTLNNGIMMQEKTHERRGGLALINTLEAVLEKIQ